MQKKEIIRLSKVPKEQLSAKVKEEQKPENYEQLSMVDSYILHVISDINYDRDIADLNGKLNELSKQNYLMRRSFYCSPPLSEK